MLLQDSRPHYDILDGLRGVAALIVIVYHVFELHAGTPVPHGYLAVDFFFILSGFVIGYAYDGRWGKMTTGGFFKRRLIRLHPMVVMGALIGAVTFLVQGSIKWDFGKLSQCFFVPDEPVLYRFILEAVMLTVGILIAFLKKLPVVLGK